MKGHARTRRKPKETEGNETGLGLRLLVTRLRRMGVGHNLVGTRPRRGGNTWRVWLQVY